jgi:hypothetical protein
VPGLNLSQEAGYPEWGLPSFYSVPLGKWQDSASITTRFLPNDRSTLYSHDAAGKPGPLLSSIHSFTPRRNCFVAALLSPSTHKEEEVGLPKNVLLFLDRSRGSAVGITSAHGLDNRGIGVRVPVVSRIFTSPGIRHADHVAPSIPKSWN